MEAASFVRKEIPNSNPQVSLNSYCTGTVSQNYDFLFHLTLFKKSAIITRVFYCAERKAFCPPTLISLWSFSRKLLSPWTSQPLSSPSTQPVLKTEPLSITQQVLIGENHPCTVCVIFPLLLLNVSCLPSKLTSNPASLRCHLWWVPFSQLPLPAHKPVTSVPLHVHRVRDVFCFQQTITPWEKEKYLFVFSAPDTKP